MKSNSNFRYNYRLKNTAAVKKITEQFTYGKKGIESQLSIPTHHSFSTYAGHSSHHLCRGPHTTKEQHRRSHNQSKERAHIGPSEDGVAIQLQAWVGDVLVCIWFGWCLHRRWRDGGRGVRGHCVCMEGIRAHGSIICSYVHGYGHGSIRVW